MRTKEHIMPVIDQVVQKLITAYKPEKIFLYGSYAYGDPGEESDVDLLIVKKTNERPIDRRVKVRKLVSDLRKKTPFSPLVVTPGELSQRITIGDDFFLQITRKGKLLYEKK